MKLNLKIYSALCATEIFEINDVKAKYKDFGTQEDMNPDDAEDYGCGNMQFTRECSTPEILAKYKITEAEYSDICHRLEDGLSFGNCGLCI